MGRSMKPEPFFKARSHQGLAECMGGWCSLRGECPHYGVASVNGLQERICEPGSDGELPEGYRAVRIVPAGSWERPGAHLLARAAPFDGLAA